MRKNKFKILVCGVLLLIGCFSFKLVASAVVNDDESKQRVEEVYAARIAAGDEPVIARLLRHKYEIEYDLRRAAGDDGAYADAYADRIAKGDEPKKADRYAQPYARAYVARIAAGDDIQSAARYARSYADKK